MATEATLTRRCDSLGVRLLAGSLVSLLTTCAGAVEIEVRGELVAIHAEEEPLHAVLEAVAERCNVEVRSNIAALELVTLDAGPRPLPRLLRTLLRDHSYVLQYGEDKEGARWLWILAPAGARDPGSTWSAMDDEEAFDELVLALADPDPEVRLETVLALGDIGGRKVEPFLSQSLDDTSEDVREAARAVLDDVVFQNSHSTPTAGTIGSQ